jgi:hypothetical protein
MLYYLVNYFFKNILLLRMVTVIGDNRSKEYYERQRLQRTELQAFTRMPTRPPISHLVSHRATAMFNIERLLSSCLTWSRDLTVSK